MGDPSKKHAVWLLLLASILLFLGMSHLGRIKPFWFDELFTFNLARTPSLSELLSILERGYDPNPPLNYLATRASLALLGENEGAARVPAMIGAWVLSLCLYLIVARHCPAPFAWLAFIIPLTTESFRYALEARPYGLVMGWCGLTLLCWQGATFEGKWKGFYLIGLAGCLAGAVSTHFYAAMLIAPLALGEAVRTIGRKRIDLPMALAFCVGLAPLLYFLPVIQRARAALGGDFWSKPKWEDIPAYYAGILGIGPLCLAGALVFLAFVPKAFLGEAAKSHKQKWDSIPIHEIAAAAGFVLLPPLAISLARSGFGVFATRYLVFSVAGFSLLVAFASARLTNNSPAIGFGLTLILLGGFCVRFVLLRQEYQAMRGYVETTIAKLDHATQTGLPIVVSNPTTYLQMDHYAPPDLAVRFTYLASPEKSRQYLKQDTSDRALWTLREWVAPRITDYDTFVSRHDHFLVYSNEAWLMSALLDHGASIRLNEGNWLEIDLGLEKDRGR